MRIAYRAARIIDGRSDQPHRRSILVLVGERVEGIFPEAQVGPDLKVIDWGEATLLPGLIDSHVHLVDDGSARPRGLVESEPHGLTLLRSAQRAFLGLSSGITALREMGAPSGIIPCLKDAVNLGVLAGPSLVTCDTQLNITGGYGRKENVLGREVDGLEGMRRAVREVFKRGGDFIKIMASGRVFAEGSKPGAEQFSPEELRTAVEETHRAGRKVTVHAIGKAAIESSLRAGVDHVEHGNFLTRDLAREMAERGIFLIPTLLAFHVLAHPPRELVLPPEIKRKAEEVWEITLEAIGLARMAGVKIGAGTDSGGPCIPHNSLPGELRLLVQAGLSPMEAIRSATGINAEILGLAEETGTLERGKWADVIAVEGDPLEDMGALSRVKLVLKKGRRIRPEEGVWGGGSEPFRGTDRDCREGDEEDGK